MSLVSEFMFEYWERNADPRSSMFPLIDGSPLKLYGSIASFYVFVKLAFLTKKDNLEIRPLVLVLNGFLFGIYFVACFFYIWFSKSGTYFLNCSPLNPDTSDVAEWYTVYANYVMVWVKIMEMTARLLPLLLNKGLPASAFNVVNSAFDLGYCYAILKMYPGNIALFSQLLHFLVCFIEFGHETLISASAEMRPLSSRAKTLLKIRLTQNAIVLLHGLFFLSQTQCLSSYNVLLCQTVYSATKILLTKYGLSKRNAFDV